MVIECTERWHKTFASSHVGILQLGNVDNTKPSTALDAKKRDLESKLRTTYANFSRDDFLGIEVLRAYRDYYKLFGNTYHVQGQLESIVHKNKSLPNVSPLVDANFLAELETLVLTAGHDMDLLVGPLRIDASQGDEVFIQMNGSVKTLKPNNMMMSDTSSVVCTILYGHDKRTAISPNTKRALYVAYAPTGVSKTLVKQQLECIRENVLLIAPDAQIERLEVFSTHA